MVFGQHILNFTGSVICRRAYSFYKEFFFLLILKLEMETKKENTLNLSAKGASIGTKKLNAEATLNPNAAKFLPFALRLQAASVTTAEISPKFVKKSVLEIS